MCVVFFRIFFIGYFLMGLSVNAAEPKSKANNSWYVTNSSDTVYVFVHGIFATTASAFSASNKVFWPDLVSTDQRFSNPSIFLGGYYTDVSSGVYKVSDAAGELFRALTSKDAMGNAAPIEKPKIVFIAHSTGGLVVRYMLDSNTARFVDKKIGLVLVASPSKGSEWANRLSFLRAIYKNEMAGELEKDNALISDLDGRFKDFIETKRIPQLVGIDTFENKFVVPGFFSDSSHVVSATNSTSYFGRPVIIPDTDHFSIAKPTDVNHSSHSTLAYFVDVRLREAWSSHKDVGAKLTDADSVVCKVSGFQPFLATLDRKSGDALTNPKFGGVVRVSELVKQPLPIVIASDGQKCSDAYRLVGRMQEIAQSLRESWVASKDGSFSSAYDQALFDQYFAFQKRLAPLFRAIPPGALGGASASQDK
jgi:pimeloyl-ACP methyl ester carboxylesterase